MKELIHNHLNTSSSILHSGWWIRSVIGHDVSYVFEDGDIYEDFADDDRDFLPICTIDLS